MRPLIKHFHSPDISNLSTHIPKVPDSFRFLLQVIVAPEGKDGSESFDIIVCTPKWLLQNHNREDVIIGRPHLIVFEYNFPRIKQKVEEFCKGCTGATWEEVAEKVGRLGKWEFEDYKE